MNARIIVCCHKDDIMATQSPYVPLQVGRAASSVRLPIAGDDTGPDHISGKNPSYCELTGIYWAWKNLTPDTDVVGVCHYRRYFDFHRQIGFPHAYVPTSRFPSTDLSIPPQVLEQVGRRGRVVVASSRYMRETIEMGYCFSHESSDYRTLLEVITEQNDPAIARACRRVLHRGVCFHPYNMFLMSRADFDAYCSWLFPLLGEVERRIGPLGARNPYQQRVFGFIAERLLNVWLTAKHKKLMERPVICFRDDPPRQRANQHYLTYRLAGGLKELGIMLLRM